MEKSASALHSKRIINAALTINLLDKVLLKLPFTVFLSLLFCLPALAQPADGTTTFDGSNSNVSPFGSLPRSGVVDGWEFTTNGSGSGSINHNGANSPSNVNMFVGSATSISIKSSDGSEFDLNNFRAQWFVFSGTYTITAYRDGASQGSTTATASTVYTTVDLSSNTNFDNIDEFEFSGFGGANVTLNLDEVDITVSSSDTDPPVVQSITLVGTPPANSTAVSYTVSFDENANNISTDDFSVTTTSGTASGVVSTVSASSGTSITATVGSISGTGAIRLDLNGATNIEDDSGNAGPAAFTSGGTHTVDRDEPTISSTSPTDGATGIVTNSNITINFSENIAFGSGNIQIIDLDDGSGTVTINAAAPGTQATISSNVLTLNPTTDLEESTNYAVQIASTAIDDANTNSFAGITDNTTLNFTTADETAPTISSTAPTDGATGIATNSNITINFSENIAFGSGSIQIIDLDDGSGTVTINAAAPGTQATISSNVLTLNPTTDLEESTNYAVQIASTAIDDTNANSFAGIADNTTLNFTTADETAPTISSTAPTDGATGIATNSNITINFSENIAFGSGNIQIIDLDDGSGTVTINAAAPGTQATISSNVLTLNPTTDLEESTNYAVQIASTAIDDTNANSFAGIADNTTLNFTTADETAPTISSTAPTDGATGIATNSNITINFSENIAFGSGNIQIIDLDDGSGTVTINVAAPGAQATISSNVLTLNPSTDIEDLTNYAVQIAATAIDDLNGNSFAGILDNTTLNFFTSDTSGPNLTSSTPTDGTTDVPIEDNIIITFDENISFGSGNIQIIDLDDGSGSIIIDVTSPGTVASISNSTLTLNPSSFLEEGVNYAIQIASTAIEDLSGNPYAGISNNTTLNFTTIAAPQISVGDATAVTEGNSGTTNADFTISLNHASPKTVTVQYLTADGTATTADNDYVGVVAITLTFSPGETSKQVSVLVNGDLKDEDDESFSLNLQNPSNASIQDNQGFVTITDDDNAPTIQFNSVSSSGLESISSANIQVDLSATSAKTISVNYVVSGSASGSGIDYTLANGTLNITPDNNNGNISISSIVDDLLDEADETIILTLSSPVNASLGTNTVHTYTINDNDSAPTIAFSSTSSSGDESVSNTTLQVALSAASGLDATVGYAVTGTASGGGTDYTLANGTLTINAGSTNNTITVANIIDDAILEEDETVVVTLSSPTNASLGTNIIYTYTIINNDNAAVTIADVAGSENGGNITITATLDNAVQGGFTIDVSTVDGTATVGDNDYTSITGQTLTFAGNAGETQTFNLSPTGDTKLEANETLQINQSNLSNTSTGVIITDDATVTINNDDNAAVTIMDVSGAENDGDITVTATLDNAVQGGFTVDVGTSDGTATTSDGDYTAITAQTLTFTGVVGETQTFVITPTPDTKLEDDETLTVSQSNLANTTLSIDITDGATVTINNDDNAVVTIADTSGNEDDGTITVTATLSSTVQGGFTVDVNTTDGTATTGDSDYTALVNRTLTFAGNEGEIQTFTISPISDNKLEANETLTVSQSNLANTALNVTISDEATITITNDDNAAVTIVDVNSNEDDGNITVTATLDNTVQGGFSVDVSTANGTATVADNDYSPIASQTLTFAGTAGENQIFVINPVTDSKVEPNETLTINQSNLANTTLSIDITDGATITINNDDNTPVITTDQNFGINENSSNSSSVGAVVATDSDAGTTFQNWTITGGNDDVNGDLNLPFTLNSTTGEITVNDMADLDAESGKGSFSLRLTVSDGANTSLEETVSISIIDENDVIPVITASQSFDIDENADNSTNLGTVIATDGDISLTTFSQWTITAGNDQSVFDIDENNGEITIADNTNLDREITASFALKITVTDGVNTSAEETVTVTVNDLNDELPVISENQIFMVNESVSNGTLVGTVEATDNDVTTTVFSNWTIISGNDDGIFEIDGNSGQLSVANNAQLDFETTTSYSLGITVSDGENTSTTENITINVVDTNESPSITGLTDVTMEEDGIKTLSFTVADADTDLNNLQFELSIDNDIVFDLTGIIVTGDMTDRILNLTPNNNQFGTTQLTVTVSDGEFSSSATILVTVSPVNDPPTATNISNNSIVENTAIGTEVGNFSTEDADSEDTHSYSLITGEGDTDNASFTIEGTALQTNSALDFEDGETRTLRVRTEDSAGAAIETIFTITLIPNPDLELGFNTAFTPNGDGVNDTWLIDNITLHPDAKVLIFNREGRAVFESIGYDNPWDGTFEGKVLPPDTYYYMIDLDETRRYKGFVMILK